MPTGRIIWNGKPGEVWTNATDRFKYQMVCDLAHTCGTCLQFHLAISNWWPIPFHRNCRCSNRPIKPGQSARPFESFRGILEGLDPVRRTEAIGQSNFRLLESGVVKWEDIVTETRVRSLKEVVAARKLSIPAMEKAGVSRKFAADAFAAVHTPEQELIRQHRKALVEQIEKAGLSREQIKDAVARGIHQRVAIGAGPSRSQSIPEPMRPDRLPEALKRAFQRFGTGSASPAAPAAPTPPKPEPAPPKATRFGPADMVRYAAEQGYEVQALSPAELKERFGATDADLRRGIMLYDGKTRRIYLNPSAEIFDQPDVAAYIAKQHANRWMASGHPMAVIDHEIGHAKHHAASPDRYRDPALEQPFDPDTAKRIAGWVSGYAATNPLEFVAEVYSGMKGGKVYSKAVMDYYGSLGGVIPK